MASVVPRTSSVAVAASASVTGSATLLRSAQSKYILPTLSAVSSRAYSSTPSSSSSTTSSLSRSRPRSLCQKRTPTLSANPSLSNNRFFSFTSATRQQTTPFLLADIGEGITECEIIQWFVKPGDKIAQFDKICEVQSDKASVEITSRFDGTIYKLCYNVGDMAKVGSSLVELIVEGGEEVAPAAAATAPTTPAAPSSAPTPTPTATSTTTISEAGERAMTFATPAVRRVAKENNVDLSKVKGTGKDARILKEDVLNYVAVSKGLAPITTPSAASSSSSSSAPAPAPTVTAADSLVNLSPIQKSMFKTMTKSLQIPHFGYSEEINMNNASTFRAKVNQLLASSAQPGQYGSLKKITYMPILIKAYSVALSKFPILNAQVTNNTSGNVNDVKLLMRANHNIGVAMDTPQGLIVPNIKSVQTKSILEIAQDLERLKQLGSQNAIPPQDLTGGTVSLSNIGVIGGTTLSPVIVSTEVMISALGKISTLPRYDSRGEVIPTQIMSVSVSADHRVIDGVTVGKFVDTWKRLVEDPVLLGLELK